MRPRVLAGLDGPIVRLAGVTARAERRYAARLQEVFPGLASPFIRTELERQLDGSIDGGLPRNYAVAFRDAYRRIAAGFELANCPDVEASLMAITAELHAGPFPATSTAQDLIEAARTGAIDLAVIDQGDPHLLRSAAAAAELRTIARVTHFNVRLRTRDLDLIASILGTPDRVLAARGSALARLATARGWHTHVVPQAGSRYPAPIG